MSYQGKRIQIKLNSSKKPSTQVDDSLNLICNAVESIFQQKVSDLSFEEIYRNCYQMILHHSGDVLYRKVTECMAQQASTILQEISKISDELLLKELCIFWDQYKLSTTTTSDVLQYMDTNYVKNYTDKLPLFENGMHVFHSLIMQHGGIGYRLQQILLENISLERDGKSIDRFLMKRATNMLQDLQSYKNWLETPLLIISQQFFSHQSQLLLQQMSIPEYLHSVATLLRQEQQRVQYYLQFSTMSKLEQLLRQEMLVQHLETILKQESSGFFVLLQQDDFGALQQCFELFFANDFLLHQLRDALKQFISEFVERYVTDAEKCKTPVTLMEGLLQLKQKYDTIVKRAFHNEPIFVEAVSAALENSSDGTVQKRQAEFTSLFVDHCIRSCIAQEDSFFSSDYDSLFEKVIPFFKFIRDKDVFEKYYKIHLCKRLLSFGRQVYHSERQTIVQEMEKNFISKLKRECGYQFTSKMELMFTDLKTSQEAMEDFQLSKEYENLLGAISWSNDFYAHVLTSSVWPIVQLQHQVILPLELEECCKRFSTFYNEMRHSGRKLMWQKHMGTGVITARFPQGIYELFVPTTIMVILLLYNQKQEYTLQELKQLTNIPEKELKRDLLSLCIGKTKILIRNSERQQQQNLPPQKSNLVVINISQVVDSDRFVWNEQFKSASMRLKIGTLVTKETEEEVEQTEAKIERDRTMEIEAALVRIMKSRKRLHHLQLQEELVKMVQHRFIPKPSDVKKRIESLIEREFLERDEQDHNLYIYVA